MRNGDQKRKINNNLSEKIYYHKSNNTTNEKPTKILIASLKKHENCLPPHQYFTTAQIMPIRYGNNVSA